VFVAFEHNPWEVGIAIIISGPTQKTNRSILFLQDQVYHKHFLPWLKEVWGWGGARERRERERERERDSLGSNWASCLSVIQQTWNTYIMLAHLRGLLAGFHFCGEFTTVKCVYSLAFFFTSNLHFNVFHSSQPRRKFLFSSFFFFLPRDCSKLKLG
jgi:hypothetical protein